jgi:hypothetical protein
VGFESNTIWGLQSMFYVRFFNGGVFFVKAEGISRKFPPTAKSIASN